MLRVVSPSPMTMSFAARSCKVAGVPALLICTLPSTWILPLSEVKLTLLLEVMGPVLKLPASS